MVQKRPFVEELYDVSSKHPRQLEHSSQLVSFLEFPSEDVVHKPHTSGEGQGSFTKSIYEHSENLGSGNITELLLCTEKDVENSLCGCNSNSSWATSSTSEEDARSEAQFHILVSSEYYNSDHPIRTFGHSEDVYSSLWEHPSRKLVSIGPDFQADIPEWCAYGAKDISTCSDSAETSTLSPHASGSNPADCIVDENKFVGTCVIPVTEVEPSACNGDKVGDGRTNCLCEDPGSVRCVRQHIMEARENLTRALGQERFLELGFCDMGELVAEKWSEEDEQLFHEVVFSNPASLGKNFWNHLSVVFPYRTKKEIVSYYFNVFMLQRRAEQNRCDPMNIDSDNDEWQGRDDEVQILEDDEDSVVESPVCHGSHNDADRNEICEDDSPKYDGGIAHTSFDQYEDVDYAGFKGIATVSETCPRELLNTCSTDPTFQCLEKILSDEREGDHDFQDDSCTSSDTGAAQLMSPVRVNSSKHWAGTFNGISGEGGHEFVSEPRDAKVWDVGYLTCPRNKVDFLPTCSMIEEVFGVEAWNYKARDSNG